MRTLKLTLAYDGTRFVGWQRQGEGESIQGLLEDALGVVRQQTVLMRRCLETPGKLMDALKCRYAYL